MSAFLPTSVKEIQTLGWTHIDVILITGDAYIDHPSFGVAVIGRVLEKLGLHVAILPQPNWRDDLRDFKKLGQPRLFFGIASGSMDSMINHYTANKRLRSDDAYTPGNKAGSRPDYATYVYTKIVKELYPETPVILGGIEASLRRFVHYDYWSDMLKPSILFDTKADLLVYGMGEKAIKEIALKLQQGESFSNLTHVPQTAYLKATKNIQSTKDTIIIADWKTCKQDKKQFAKAFAIIETESNKVQAAQLIQSHGDVTVFVNPPYTSYTQQEIDEPYELPYTRLPHPRYQKKEPIPAYEMIRNSINIHRGCFGGCSFCTISAHQGKFILSRSEKSIVKEIEQLTKMPDFKGHISDLGGPSANMYQMQGKDLIICNTCKRPSCIFPEVCKNLNTDHTALIHLYQKVQQHPKIKRITIGSGIRHDMLIGTKYPHPSHEKYLTKVILEHTSGRLKVAPEHTESTVLKLMRKPSFSSFIQLKELFEKINKKHGLKQQLIPYLISAHPGTKTTDMANLAAITSSLNYRLEQVQEFTPTPMTLSSVMYYTGLDPYTMEPVYIPKQKEERMLQKLFFFWYMPENKITLTKILFKLHKDDLIKRIWNRQ